MFTFIIIIIIIIISIVIITVGWVAGNERSIMGAAVAVTREPMLYERGAV
jgi:hypothetical protein